MISLNSPESSIRHGAEQLPRRDFFFGAPLRALLVGVFCLYSTMWTPAARAAPLGTQARNAGNAMMLNGIDQYALVPASDSLSVGADSTKLTVEAWVYLVQHKNFNAIATVREDFSANQSWALFIAKEGQIFFKINTEVNAFFSESFVPLNEWTHVAVVFDGHLPEAERKKLYINGQLDKVGSSVFRRIFDVDARLFMGVLAQNPDSHFAGQIDEVRVWDRALSTTEIRDQMSRTLTGNEANLKGYWTFDDAPGTNKTSVAGLDASFVGSPSFPAATTPLGYESFHTYSPAGSYSKTTTLSDAVLIDSLSPDIEGIQLYQAEFVTGSVTVDVVGVFSVIADTTGDHGYRFNFTPNSYTGQSLESRVMSAASFQVEPNQTIVGTTYEVGNGATMAGKEYYVTPIDVLPIELTDFSAEVSGDAVVLTWETATEINNAYFTVERSTDGQHFEAVGQVTGAGNSGQSLSYTWQDVAPPAGRLYYRLKQTDFDGTYAWFTPQEVRFLTTLRVVSVAQQVQASGLSVSVATDQ
ncbi:MAG: LamG domain-containing protein, partial [Catalinimonas sp.]